MLTTFWSTKYLWLKLAVSGYVTFAILSTIMIFETHKLKGLSHEQTSLGLNQESHERAGVPGHKSQASQLSMYGAPHEKYATSIKLSDLLFPSKNGATENFEPTNNVPNIALETGGPPLPGIDGYDYKPYWIVRLLSNDMPPIHSSYQTYINTKYIIDTERLPENFQRFWVVSCIVDRAKLNRLKDLLERNGESFHEIAFKGRESESEEEAIKSVFDVNKARNEALKLAFSRGAHWVYLFDGATFLTSHTYATYLQFLSSDESNKYIFSFTSMYRLNYRINITADSSFNEVFPYISGLQEAHIAVNKRFLAIRNDFAYTNGNYFLFDEARGYGSRDKLHLIWYLREKYQEVTHCHHASPQKFAETSVFTRDDNYEIATKCGFSIRLPYYPEPSASFNQSHSRYDRFLVRDQAFARLKDKIARKLTEKT